MKALQKKNLCYVCVSLSLESNTTYNTDFYDTSLLLDNLRTHWLEQKLFTWHPNISSTSKELCASEKCHFFGHSIHTYTGMSECCIIYICLNEEGPLCIFLRGIKNNADGVRFFSGCTKYRPAREIISQIEHQDYWDQTNSISQCFAVTN